MLNGAFAAVRSNKNRAFNQSGGRGQRHFARECSKEISRNMKLDWSNFAVSELVTDCDHLLCVLREHGGVADEQITCYLVGKNGQRKEH